MLFGFKQPLVGLACCVTTLRTAAKETTSVSDPTKDDRWAESRKRESADRSPEES